MKKVIMNEVSIIVSTLAILFSLVALIVGCVAISMVSGFLRSTHTVSWQPLVGKDVEENEEVDDGPFAQDADAITTARAPKLKRKPVAPSDFAFMEDVADSSNY